MVSVADSTAVTMVMAGVFLAAGWGAYLSLGSASRGPLWALRHLQVAVPTWAGLLGLMVLVTVVVRPRWAGIGLSYVVLIAWVIAFSLRRSLQRWESHGGLGEIEPERRVAVLRSSRAALLGGGAVMAAISLLATGAARWGGVALGSVLAGTGALVGRQKGP